MQLLFNTQGLSGARYKVDMLCQFEVKLEIGVFLRGEKQQTCRKIEQGMNQQQTQPTHQMLGSGF